MDRAFKPTPTKIPNGWEIHVAQMERDTGVEEKDETINQRLCQKTLNFTFFSLFLAF